MQGCNVPARENRYISVLFHLQKAPLPFAADWGNGKTL